MATLEDAFYWRNQGYHPYRLVVDRHGNELELISFPSPEEEGVYVQARQYNDPTTMKSYHVSELSPRVHGLTVRELRNRIAHLAKLYNVQHQFVTRRQAGVGIVAVTTLEFISRLLAETEAELVVRQFNMVRLLLEYGDKDSAVRKVALVWYKRKTFHDTEMIRNAVAELDDMEKRRVPRPEYITDEMVQEILRLRLALLEWLP